MCCWLYVSTWQIFVYCLVCSGLSYLAASNSTIAVVPLIFAILTTSCIAGYNMFSGVGVFSFIRSAKVTVSFGLRNWKQSLLTGILSISVYSVAL
jgi:hypothetical protein